MIEPPQRAAQRESSPYAALHQQVLQTLCALTQQAIYEVKDQFYKHLDSVVNRIPMSEHIYILGGFNTTVGANRKSWPRVLGYHGIGKLNGNGQRLLELCCYHSLCVTNTHF